MTLEFAAYTLPNVALHSISRRKMVIHHHPLTCCDQKESARMSLLFQCTLLYIRFNDESLFQNPSRRRIISAPLSSFSLNLYFEPSKSRQHSHRLCID